MYQKFDLKKDKELILLNYYIATNQVDNKINLTTAEVAELLGINKTKAHRLLSKFQELGIIEPAKISDSKNKKTTYLYMANETVSETNNACKINICTGVNETVNEQDRSKKTYKDIYKEVFQDANEIQVNAVLNVSDIDTIDVKLFRVLLEESALKANKNPHSYARTIIKNSIRDNVRTLEDREKFQERRAIKLSKERVVEGKSKAWNYTEDTSGIDFDYLAAQTRRY